MNHIQSLPRIDGSFISITRNWEWAASLGHYVVTYRVVNAASRDELYRTTKLGDLRRYLIHKGAFANLRETKPFTEWND